MPDTRTVDVAGVTIRYRDTGDTGTTPVLLLHGGSSSAATWNALTAALVAAGRRVIAPDLRGHGGSSRTASYPLSGFRDDVLGLLDALSLPTVALIGHSLGGHAASLIAQQQADRVTRLVLEEPPAPPRTPAARHPPAGQLLGMALGGLDPRRRYHRRAITSAIRQLREADPAWWDRLAAITAPTLVVSGGTTSHISPERLAEAAAAIPHARLVTIPVGHRVHSRAPAEYRDAVVPFLTADA